MYKVATVSGEVIHVAVGVRSVRQREERPGGSGGGRKGGGTTGRDRGRI